MSIIAEKPYDKIQHSILIKAFSRQEIQGIHPSAIIAIKNLQPAS